MRAIVIAFVLFLSVENCSGRYHRGGLSYRNPRHGIPLKESTLWDEECKDDPSYDCKDIAQTEGLCKEQEAFTRTSCALSCGWCAPSTERIPAPEICEADLPKWAPICPEWADAGECDDPKRQTFMQHYCRKSCKLPCKPESTTSPEEKRPILELKLNVHIFFSRFEPETDGIQTMLRQLYRGSRRDIKSPDVVVKTQKKFTAFCHDRDVNCARWKSLGACKSKDPTVKHRMSVYCGVTCDTCREPTPKECHDKGPNCTQMKKKGNCHSTVPVTEYEVKTNCLKTCEFCDSVPDQP